MTRASSSMDCPLSAARTRRRVFTSSSRLRIVMLATALSSVRLEAQSTHRLRCNQGDGIRKRRSPKSGLSPSHAARWPVHASVAGGECPPSTRRVLDTREKLAESHGVRDPVRPSGHGHRAIRRPAMPRLAKPGGHLGAGEGGANDPENRIRGRPRPHAGRRPAHPGAFMSGYRHIVVLTGAGRRAGREAWRYPPGRGSR